MASSERVSENPLPARAEGAENHGMKPGRRPRLPWVIAAVAGIFFVPTVILTALNGSFSDPFLFLAVAMVVGYTSVGTVVASRRPDNAVGWILMVIGISFLVVGFTDEYVRYTYTTNPGSLPFGAAIAWLANWTWNVVTGSVLLLIVLYPTGRLHARLWRFLPPLIIGLSLLGALGAILRPGRVDAGGPVAIPNPTGIDAISPRASEVFGFGLTIGLIVAGLASVAAVVHRYRRAGPEERQQLRLFVYATTVATVCMVAAGASGALFRERLLSELLFYAFFAVVGIGVPAAIGVSMLRYRLLELDVVVRKTVVYGILAVLLTAFFVLVVGALGILAGTQGRVAFALIVFVVGVLTVPLWRLARRIADRVVFGGRASPYELLAGFGERMAEAYSTDEVLPHLAEILGAATGASRAEVWLRLGGRLQPASVWPQDAVADAALEMAADALPTFPEGEHAAEVRHQGELLGALSVRMPANDPMSPAKEKRVRDLAQQACLVLRNVRLIEELRASRQRIVAAQDDERRRIERNIHDGAQQQLVALAVKLGLAERMADRDAEKARELLADAKRETQEALENLRDLARGIYPPLLADQGLAPALESQARKVPFPVEVEPNGISRYPQEIEAAIYFCVLEALQNTAKYADASRAVVRLRRDDGSLVFEVVDDGRGFEPETTSRGAGLQNMEDRLAALGGALEVRSRPGGGTTVIGHLPVGNEGAAT